MVDAPVIPDREVVYIAPPVPHLQVVIVHYEAHEPVEEMPGLVIGEPVDLGHVVADGEDALPARHRVGADDRVDGLEDLADILGRTALLGEKLEVVLLGGLVEAWLSVGGRQSVQEAAERGRDAIVELVS